MLGTVSGIFGGGDVDAIVLPISGMIQVIGSMACVFQKVFTQILISIVYS